MGMSHEDAVYEQYESEQEEMRQHDKSTRIEILDAAAFVESELLAVAVRYIGGADTAKRQLADRLIDSWGGRAAAERIVRVALEEHGELDEHDKKNFQHIKELVELRNVVAHGRTHSFLVDDPTEVDGVVGRDLLIRSRKGELETKRIEFEDAELAAKAGRRAALELTAHLAKIVQL